MVQSEPTGNEVEEFVDSFLHTCEAVLKDGPVDVSEIGELGTACRIALTLRSSQSRLNVKPASRQPAIRSLICSRASGQAAQMRASASSPFESFVPPELTRLKISTTTSVVISSPDTSTT